MKKKRWATEELLLCVFYNQLPTLFVSLEQEETQFVDFVVNEQAYFYALPQCFHKLFKNDTIRALL